MSTSQDELTDSDKSAINENNRRENMSINEILAKHNGELGVTWEDPDVVTPDTIQAIQALIKAEVVKARAEVFTDVTIWANNEMAKDYVKAELTKGDK